MIRFFRYDGGDAMKVLALFYLFLCPVVVANGQADTCPSVEVSGPAEMVKRGAPMSFTAKVVGTPGTKPEYFWAVSWGTITSGSGTSSITVDTTALAHGSDVIATVRVRGFPELCETAASGKGTIMGPHCCDPLDVYGRLPWNDERARLDAAAIAQEQNRDSSLFFYLDIESKESVASAREHARKMLGFMLSRDKSLPVERIFFAVRVGQRHQTTVLDIPKGADLPAFAAGCVLVKGSELLKK